MEDLQYLEEMNVPSNLRLMMMKLPYKMRERWRAVACDLQERRGTRAMFADFVTFIERQVKIMSDPLFGDLQGTPSYHTSLKFKARPSGRGHVTVAAVDAARPSNSFAPRHQRKGPPVQKYDHGACFVCKGQHSVLKCSALEQMTHREKLDAVKENRLCFRCLMPGHMSKACDKPLTCAVCAKSHPTILHVDSKTPHVSVSNALVSLQTCAHTGAGNDECVLSIVPVRVKAKSGSHIINTYAFLDPGSSASFCTETLMRKLNLSGVKTNILLRTLGQERVVSTYSLKGFQISGLNEETFLDLPEVFTQKAMPVSRKNILSQEDLEEWAYLKYINIPSLEADVELLIGTNAQKLMEPWEVINSQGEGPYAIRTLLGWVVSGPLRGREDEGRYDCPAVTVNRISVTKLQDLLIAQYNQDFNEAIADDSSLSREDHRFMQIVESSIHQDEGHYCFDLPFKVAEVTLPDNRCVAEQRLFSLQRKFKRNKEFHQEYTEFMSEVIASGYAEPVPCQQLNRSDGRLWFLPHHGVYHPRKKTLRVVFDCASVYQGISLNSQLLQGPLLTSTLLGVLTRFRKECVALMADVQAMFHQVRVSPEYTDFLRFLWFPDGDFTLAPMQYRMKVHLFGAVSSPSCANYALRRIVQDYKDHFEPCILNTILHNFYMDDCLTSVSSEAKARKMVSELTAACAKGGFHLSKWTSNSSEVLASIPDAQRSKTTRGLDLDQKANAVETALGLHWCIDADVLTFRLALEERPPTRRGILSVVSSVFDPLGFLAPLTLPVKRMLQEMCRLNIGWDVHIPQVFSKQWSNWLKNLHYVAEFKVNRCMKPNNFGEPTFMQLHHFSDASEYGYGTVTYLRMENKENQVSLAFILGKARVAPLKQTTIPRLKLTAAVLAVRLDKMLRREFQLDLQPSVFWTDSTTVLKYIANETRRFHTFVANRVAVIRELTSVAQWRYVGTKLNPADEASRGLSAEEFLACERWLKGPPFLLKGEEEWPVTISDQPMVFLEDPEVKRESLVSALVVQAPLNATQIFLNYFSDFKRLKRSAAWILKFRGILLTSSQKRKSLKPELQKERIKVSGESLTTADLQRAEEAIIRFYQQEKFPEEIAALQEGRSVKRSSDLYKLDPRLQDGMLRVGGRLSRAAMPEEEKHPVILAKDQNVSKLILKHVHQCLGHAGRNHMLSFLRKKYWITHANSACRKVILECTECRRIQGNMGQQKMADLPEERVVSDLPAFTNVGVDYFGPVEVKKGRGRVKRYGVLFTCLASRAVHLEVAYALDTDSCINAIRRFMCRRGQISHLISDNGTNFIGAERELREAVSKLDHSKIQHDLLQNGLTWSFNPPAGAHHGGVWERLIRLVKRVLASTLRLQTLDDEGFHTVLCEIEAILNSRPITKASEDVNDLEALTPNHLLLLKTKPLLPPGLFQRDDLYLKRRWRQVQFLSDLFWKRWVREYLPLLQERHKWMRPRRSFAVGDIVVVMEPLAPRGSWQMARVTQTYPDKRGHVRSVQLRTKTGQLERPVTKICLLMEAEVPSSKTQDDDIDG
ncbi:uncharacterized protein LOC143509288 [Brachyhypopomus gauderio]|uniref:uncharacterized protein LOC143509288 n=1 Tax=Brachyhypopomus gauderio TaxID=698409 RepID=UPI00404346A6